MVNTHVGRKNLRPSQLAMAAARVANLANGEAGNSRSAKLRTYSAEEAAVLFGIGIRAIEYARKVLGEGL